MDHGSEFGAHRMDDNGYWDSEFKQYVETKGIRPILARAKYPQTNGKIEKWFHAFKRFRYGFDSLEGFLFWYNNQPHGVWISIISNLRNSHSGEDYLKRLSSVSVSECLVGALMKHLSSLKHRSMRNYLRTVHSVEMLEKYFITLLGEVGCCLCPALLYPIKCDI